VLHNRGGVLAGLAAGRSIDSLLAQRMMERAR
jgi:hypothetical protein